MTNEQIEQATRLRERGDSIRDIADKLGLSKSAVDRALKDEAVPVGDLPVPAMGKRPAPVESIELGKLDPTLSHERKMTELAIRQEELALQRRKMELDAERTENEKRLLRIREQQFEQEQRKNADRQTSHEEMLTGRFNRLVRELLKNCQDATWSEHEVADYLERVKACKTKITRFCEQYVVDEDGLAIWHHLLALVKLVEQTKEDHTAWFGSDVSFDYDKKQIRQIKAWLIKDFNEAYVKPAKKAGTDPDEDESQDEEDDDDDESALDGFEREKELVRSFNELVAKLADNGENTNWARTDYEDYLTQIETYQEELTDYIDTMNKPFNAEHQAITVNTDELLNFVTRRCAVIKDSGNVLTLYVNVEDRKRLETLPVDDFWEEIEE